MHVSARFNRGGQMGLIATGQIAQLVEHRLDAVAPVYFLPSCYNIVTSHNISLYHLHTKALLKINTYMQDTQILHYCFSMISYVMK